MLGQIVSLLIVAWVGFLTLDLASGFSSPVARLVWWRPLPMLFPFTRSRRPSMLNDLLKDSWDMSRCWTISYL